jgi:hypothetical protein
MKPISTIVHGAMDYAMALLLAAGPYLFGFGGDDTESLVMYGCAAALFLYSLLTNYEFGVVKIIPMRMHLTLDVFSGIFLAASPWLFGFADRVFIPHFILGIVEILAGLLTNPTRKDANRLI